MGMAGKLELEACRRRSRRRAQLVGEQDAGIGGWRAMRGGLRVATVLRRNDAPSGR